MANTFKGYVNYGCLSAEKRKVWTAQLPASTATASEAVEYTVPDGWDMGYNEMGGVVLTAPWGVNYRPDELLGGNEDPYFIGTDADGKGFRVKLDYRETA